jgi:glycerol-3-phosphate O-acyltransferase
MTAIGRSIPVVPVPLVATVFLRRPGERLSELEIKADAFALMRELTQAGAHVYLPRQDQDYAIDAGLRMLTLRHLVDEVDGLFLARPGERKVLAYYAGSIAHLLQVPDGAEGVADDAVPLTVESG